MCDTAKTLNRIMWLIRQELHACNNHFASVWGPWRAGKILKQPEMCCVVCMGKGCEVSSSSRCSYPKPAVRRVSVDIYFSEDLSGGHSLCLNDENKNEGVKKFTSEMQNIFFISFLLIFKSNLSSFIPGAVLAVSFRIDYLWLKWYIYFGMDC